MNYRKLLFSTLKYAVVVGALCFLIFSGKLKFSEIAGCLNHPGWVLLGSAFCLVSLILSFLRFCILQRALNIGVGTYRTFTYCFIAFFFATFMPGNVGSDLVKISYMYRDTGKRSTVIASAMVDRILGLLGILVLGGGAMLFSIGSVIATPSLHKLAVLMFALLSIAIICGGVSLITLYYGRKWGGALWGGIACAFIIYFHPYALLSSQQFSANAVDAVGALKGQLMLTFMAGLALATLCIAIVPSCQPGRRLEQFVRQYIPAGNHIMNLANALLVYHNHLAVLGISMLLTFFLQSINIVALFFFAKAISLAYMPSLLDVFYVTPLTQIANTLPVPGGGLGVGELAFDTLLSFCRDAQNHTILGGAAVFLLYRFVNIILSLLGLPFYLMDSKPVKTQGAGLEVALENSAGTNHGT